MKCFEIKASGAALSSGAAQAGARNMVVLQLSAAVRARVAQRPQVEALATACADVRAVPTAGAGQLAAAGTAARPWPFGRIVQCFGLTGEAKAFGHAIDFAPSPLAALPPDAANDGRRDRSAGWIRRSLAALRERYLSWRREVAITRAVQDIRRLDDAVLRDIGIRNRTEIEFFVRNGPSA